MTWELLLPEMSDAAVAEALAVMWAYSLAVTEGLVVIATRADVVKALPKVVTVVLNRHLDGVEMNEGTGETLLVILSEYRDKLIEKLATGPDDG